MKITSEKILIIELKGDEIETLQTIIRCVTDKNIGFTRENLSEKESKLIDTLKKDIDFD